MTAAVAAAALLYWRAQRRYGQSLAELIRVAVTAREWRSGSFA